MARAEPELKEREASTVDAPPSRASGGLPFAGQSLAAQVMRMQAAAGNRATTRLLARAGVLARDPLPYVRPEVSIRIGSPRGLTLPPDDPDCGPELVAGPDEFGSATEDGAEMISDVTPTATPVALAAVRLGSSPIGILARAPNAPSGARPSGPDGPPPIDPCLVSGTPPGSISGFEYDVRDGKAKIDGVVLDPDTDEIIGYYVSYGYKAFKIVDREGEIVDGGEPGVEAPLLDPIDFIPTPGAVVKGAAVIGKVGLKVLGKFTAKEAGGGLLKMSAVALPRLRRTSLALFGRAARAAGKQLPRIARELTEAELNHSFDRHAGEWFGRAVTRGADFAPWKSLLEQATKRGRRFAWSLRETPTIAHLLKTDSGYLVVQFSTETGELMSAFRPRGPQLKQMLKMVRLAGE